MTADNPMDHNGIVQDSTLVIYGKQFGFEGEWEDQLDFTQWCE